MRAFRYRLYPSKAQVTRLEQTLSLCCELYNAALQERREASHLECKSLRYTDQQNQLPEIKALREDVAAVHSQVLQDVLRRLDKAFQNFFRRVKERGQKAGFPRFRSRSRYDSFSYAAVEPEPLAVSSEAEVGIDVGLRHFATLSAGGERIPNPRFFREEQRALAKAQRRLSAAKKGTLERRARRRIVTRIHERIKFRRHNFAHQESRRLVNRFGMIFFEDLNIRGMVKNHCLAKSIADAAWQQLFQRTNYKVENTGGLCEQVDACNTSKLTACCGEMVEMTLADREIHCPKSHSTTDRDWNAALNILARGLAQVGLRAREAPCL